MAISPLNAPVNTAICSSPGTIFSGGGSGGGGGQTYDFQNVGNGAKVLVAPIIGSVVPLRTLKQGPNMSIVEEASDIVLGVPDLVFDSTKPSTSSIVGLSGKILGGNGIISTLQALIYPIRPPVVSITIAPVAFEFGDTSILTVNWSVVRTDEDITIIIVNNQNIIPTGGNQSGTVQIANPGTGTVTVTMSAATATKNTSTQASSSAMRKVRYGYLSKDGITSQITDQDINNSVNILNSFYSSGVMGPFQFNIPTGNYLVIIIPTAFGGNWSFLINGFNNNAFNLVRSGQPYINKFGFSDPVNIWVSQVVATGPILLAPYQTN